MKVTKRDGSTEAVKLDKILSRIKRQTYSLDAKFIEPMNIAKIVIDGLYDGITSEQLDILAAETAASMTSQHPDYSILAARLEISRLQKDVPKSFYEVIKNLYNHVDPRSGRSLGSISDELMSIVEQNHVDIEEAIIHDRDFNYDYFGYKTLEKSYLLKINNKVAETPQHMLMRVSLGIHGDDIESAIKTYDLMSQKYMTHATPTLFNSGTNFPQMSSCFLITVKDDSIDGIYDTLKTCALISKNAGGIGLAIHNIRAKGTHIKGTNGSSNGIIPMIKVFNETANYVDQCFASDTMISKENSEIKISELKIGDKVNTSNGEDEIIDIKTSIKQTITVLTNKGKIEVTPNHIFLALKNGKNEDNVKEKIRTGLLKIEWIEAQNLTSNDLLLNK